MAWLLTIEYPSPAKDCPITVEEAAFDVAYSTLLTAVIVARARTNERPSLALSLYIFTTNTDHQHARLGERTS